MFIQKKNSLRDLMDRVKTKLSVNMVWEHEAKGAMIRSKERWIQEGGKSTKYFLNLGKKWNIVNKATTSLQTKDCNVTTSQEELLKEQVRYYKDLYKV